MQLYRSVALAAALLGAAIPYANASTAAAAANASASTSRPGTTPGAIAGQAKSAPLDQVYVRSKRDGSVAPVATRVERNGLDKVVCKAGDKETSYDGGLVERINFGDVPQSFRDGLNLLDRGLHSDAVAQLRSAAGDASARDVVKAAARLEAAEALLRWGATEPARFVEAATEAQAFLSGSPGNRETPRARALLGRALWLAGKPAEAGATLKALWAELKDADPTPGYSIVGCLNAGIHAARALADAKDTEGAKQIYIALEAQAGRLAAGASADDALKLLYQSISDEASLGAGYVDLAAGQAKQALTFFQNKVGALKPDSTHALRFGARLGLGEALLADGKLRDAWLHLARAAALDPQDADRAARALVRLAECYSKLGDSDARLQACSRIKAVLSTAGATPAAVRARQLQKELGC